MGKFKDADLTIKTIKQFPDLKKTLRKGVISTIESPAKKFVDIRTRIKKAGGYRDGGRVTSSGPVTSKRMTQEQLDRIKRDQIRRNPRDFDLETGARLTEKSKMDRIKKRKKRVHKLAMGGEAAESVGRATVERSQRKIRRKEVDDMLDRLYGKKSTIKPKKKPKEPKRITEKKSKIL